MKKSTSTLFVLLFVCLHFSSLSINKCHANPIDIYNSSAEVVDSTIDPIETTARLLMRIDEMIEKVFENNHQTFGEHYYMTEDVSTSIESTAVTPNNEPQQEERFSALLGDIKKIEEMITIAITKANSNRQYRLVMRLRPLLSYVQQIYRNMEMLRARVVAIATLSNIAVTVNDVLIQFGDVMTSSQIMSTGILPKESKPKDRISTISNNNSHIIDNTPTKFTENVPSIINNSNPSSSQMLASSSNDTLSYVEIGGENYFKNILQHK